MEILNYQGHLITRANWENMSTFTRPKLEDCTVLESPYEDVYYSDFVNDIFNEDIYQTRKTVFNNQMNYNRAIKFLNRTNYLEANYAMFKRVSEQDGQDYYDRHKSEFDERIVKYNELQVLQDLITN